MATARDDLVPDTDMWVARRDIPDHILWLARAAIVGSADKYATKAALFQIRVEDVMQCPALGDYKAVILAFRPGGRL